MACKLTKSIDGKVCAYEVAGARAVYLANYYPPVIGAAIVAGKIAYTIDTDGIITSVKLPTGEFFYHMDAATNSLSFTDALLVGGNNNKYRQQTLNMVLNRMDVDILNEGDALSLGKFVAFVVTSNGILVLGRDRGLEAPAGGFDYASGAAEADASGWTSILQAVSGELTKMVLNEAVLTPLYVSPDIEE